MKTVSPFIKILLFSCFLSLAGACSRQGPEDGGAPEDLTLVTAVSLSEKALSLQVGESVRLVADVRPENAFNGKVHWSSSSTDVATVNTSGLVRAVSPGDAIITATAGDFSATCRITVEKPFSAVSGISLERAFIAVSIGETYALAASVLPSDATDQAVSWTSSRPEIATVSSEGRITALSSGQAVVTAAAGEYSSSCQVVVIPEGPGNVLEYTSMGGGVVKPYDESAFDAVIVSNTYEGGKGVIVFDKPVSVIGDMAFYACSSLLSVSLPKSVRQIGSHAFENCSVMIRCTVQTGVERIGDSAFAGCSSLRTLVFPDTVSEMGASVLRNCSLLQRFYIPEGVASLGAFAFTGCSGLQMLFSTRPVPPSVGSRSLESLGNCLIFVRPSSLDAYRDASGWKNLSGNIRAIAN